ncbi:MAG: glycerate kinase [Thermoplasmata archaeon]
MIRNSEELIARPTSPRLQAMRRDALAIFEAGLKAVDPRNAIAAHLRRQGEVLHVDGLELDLGRYECVRLIAFGKASVAMTKALLERVQVDEGLVVSDQEEGFEAPGMVVVQAGHPHPNEGSFQGGEKALKIVRKCGPRDLLLVLLSGGGSAMLEYTDMPLEDLREVSDLLLKSGMDIGKLNTVRKHLSDIKGGRLGKEAAARGAEVVTIAISDVVGDQTSFIASGPTVPDETTFLDAKKVLQDFGLWDLVPDAVRRRIEAGAGGMIPETPKPGDSAFARSRYFIVASNGMACRAAAEEARKRGYEPIILTTRLQGEAREVAHVLAAIARSVDEGLSLPKPGAIIVGGETTVTVRGGGTGGRNQELVLAAVPYLEDQEIVMMSCGTDGLDGSTDAAGAIADAETLQRALKLGMNPADYLADNDSHRFFQKLGDAIITGPTGTNVMDLQVILIG